MPSGMYLEGPFQTYTAAFDRCSTSPKRWRSVEPWISEKRHANDKFFYQGNGS